MTLPYLDVQVRDCGPDAPSRSIPAGNAQRLENMSSFQSMLRPVATIWPSPTKRVRVQASAKPVKVGISIAAERASAADRERRFFMENSSHEFGGARGRRGSELDRAAEDGPLD